jgi:diaminopimelate epimerase
MSRDGAIPFTKMHGAGNDYVVLDGVAAELPPIEPIAARLADRHFGIGCDQILVVRPSDSADFRMDIYNTDGSRAEMCGNGLRAFYEFVRSRGHTAQDEIRVETLAGIMRPRRVAPGVVRVDMGPPFLAPAKIPTTLGAGDGPVLDVPLEVEAADGAGRERLVVSSVGMGNPHCILYVDDVARAPVTTLGPRIEQHPAFPNRTNVEFVQIVSRSRLAQRTWERGTGETLACGSGACAVAVASVLRGVVERDVVIALPGGELRLEWAGAPGAHVFMTGPATEVFTGRIALEGA